MLPLLHYKKCDPLKVVLTSSNRKKIFFNIFKLFYLITFSHFSIYIMKYSFCKLCIWSLFLRVLHFLQCLVIEYGALIIHSSLVIFSIKNVSSSTSHFVFTSLRLSLREFKKILSDIFIYISILIKSYMIANIMNMQIFNLIKYDLNGNWRS